MVLEQISDHSVFGRLEPGCLRRLSSWKRGNATRTRRRSSIDLKPRLGLVSIFGATMAMLNFRILSVHRIEVNVIPHIEFVYQRL